MKPLMAGHRDYDDYDFGPLKHSGLGVASFIIAIGAGVMIAIVVFLAAVIESRQPGALDALDHDSPGAMALGGAACFAFLLAIIGVGLGIAGVCQRERKTVFAIIGLVLNGLILLGGGCLVLIGIATSGPF
jgi:hypothetical protein